jgi:hypothetical protein
MTRGTMTQAAAMTASAIQLRMPTRDHAARLIPTAAERISVMIWTLLTALVSA